MPQQPGVQIDYVEFGFAVVRRHRGRQQPSTSGDSVRGADLAGPARMGGLVGRRILRIGRSFGYVAARCCVAAQEVRGVFFHRGEAARFQEEDLLASVGYGVCGL